MIKEILYITVVSTFPFIFSLQGNFVFDDSEAIVKNKDVISESWLDAFDNDFWGTNIKSNLSHKSYRPLTILSFRLNYYLSNRTLIPTQFKAVNLVCHLVCCILVWRTYNIIWKALRDETPGTKDVPLLAAMMFAVHPVHVEAVSGIVGRADLLAALTFLLAFIIHERSARTKSYINIYFFISLSLAGTSMLFKENGITVLAILCMRDYMFNFRTKKDLLTLCVKCKNKYVNFPIIYRMFCIFTKSIVSILVRWTIMGKKKPEFKPTDNPTAFADSDFTKIATYNYIYFLNITLFVWPEWLCYDWSMGCIPLIEHVHDFRILFPIILYLYILLFMRVVLGNTEKSYKRVFILAVGLTVLPFLPAANLLYEVGFVVAERILYIPSVGYCFLIALGANQIAKKIKPKLVISCFYFIILIYSLKSYKRAFDWQNENNLFTKALDVCPLNAKVHYNIAKVADAQQNTTWALEEYKEAIRLYPKYYQAMNNLANLLKSQKEYHDAELHLRKALYYKNEFPAAWMNLGIVLAKTKRYGESENAYQTALQFRKKYPDCYYNLGNLYLEMKRNEYAMENWYKAINLNPKHMSAWTNLLALLDNTGQTDEALQIIPDALLELPDVPSINFAVANIYGRINNYAEAEKYFFKAIQLFGDKVQAIHYANLGVLYHRWRKYDLAENNYAMALQLDPNFPSAIKNLQKIKNIKNKQ